MKKIMSIFKQKKSGRIAYERLNQLLLTDRLSCSISLIDHIHEDLCIILNKYNEIDTSNIQVEFLPQKEDSGIYSSIIVYIPFIQSTQE